MPELPIAVHTVRCGFFGRQLAAAVQLVANRSVPHTQYIARARYYNGTVLYIGQAGGFYRHLRVVPSLGGPHYIRLDEHYQTVEVTSFSWEPPDRYPSEPMMDLIVPEVIEFAAELQKVFDAGLTDGFPEYVHPGRIPWEADSL